MLDHGLLLCGSRVPDTPEHGVLERDRVLLDCIVGSVREAPPHHAGGAAPHLHPNSSSEAPLFHCSLSASTPCEPPCEALNQLFGVCMRPAEAAEDDGLIYNATILQFVCKGRDACCLPLAHRLHEVRPCSSSSGTAHSNIQSYEAPREVGRASKKVCGSQPRM